MGEQDVTSWGSGGFGEAGEGCLPWTSVCTQDSSTAAQEGECKRVCVVDKRSPCSSSSFLRAIDLPMVQAGRGLNQGNDVYHLAERFSLL